MTTTTTTTTTTTPVVTTTGRTWGEYTWAVSDQSTDPSRPHMDIGGNPSVLYDVVTKKLVLQFVRGLLEKKSQSQTCNPATTNWWVGLSWRCSCSCLSAVLSAMRHRA